MVDFHRRYAAVYVAGPEKLSVSSTICPDNSSAVRPSHADNGMFSGVAPVARAASSTVPVLMRRARSPGLRPL